VIIIILLSLDVEKVGIVCVVVIWEGGKQDRFVGSAKNACRGSDSGVPPGGAVLSARR